MRLAARPRSSSSSAATSASGMNRPPNVAEVAARRRRRTAGRLVVAGSLRRGATPGHQRGTARRGVAVRDQRLADQHDVGALGRRSAVTSCGPGDAGLGDLHDVVGDAAAPAGRTSSGSTSRVLQVAGVDADQLGAERRRRARSPPRRAPRPATVRPELARLGRAAGASVVVGRARRRSAAPGRRRRRGPRAAGRSSTMKSLRSTGSSTAARTARRSSRLPPNRRSSVSTLIAAAPPAAYARGERGRVGDVGEVALARAAPLDLGDHARPRARGRPASGRAAAGRRPSARPQVGSAGRVASPLGEVLAHAGDDVVEHGHGRPHLCFGDRIKRLTRRARTPTGCCARR